MNFTQATFWFITTLVFLPFTVKDAERNKKHELLRD